MADKVDNLWSDVGNRCLTLAKAALNSEAVPTAETVETAQRLVDMAVAIDTLNLQWELQSQSCAAAFPGRTSSPRATGN